MSSFPTHHSLPSAQQTRWPTWQVPSPHLLYFFVDPLRSSSSSNSGSQAGREKVASLSDQPACDEGRYRGCKGSRQRQRQKRLFFSRLLLPSTVLFDIKFSVLIWPPLNLTSSILLSFLSKVEVIPLGSLGPSHPARNAALSLFPLSCLPAS